MSGHYFLYFKSTKEKSGPFDAKAASEIIQRSGQPLEQCYVVQKGWPEWKLAQDVQQVAQYLLAIENLELPEFPELPTEASFQAATQSIKEKRKHERKELRLKTVFTLDKKVFRTFTVNLSEGGMMIDKEIPQEFSGKEVDIYVASPDGKLQVQFKAVLIATQKRRHLQFTKADEVAMGLLKSWLQLAQVKKAA